MLDISLITKPEEKPKHQKRVTHSVKETGLVGGQNLIVLTALVENGAMTTRQMAEYLDWHMPKCASRLCDLVRLELAEKIGLTNEGRILYAAKEKR